MKRMLFAGFGLLALLVVSMSADAQSKRKDPNRPKKHHTGSWYFSWGYNTEWYTPSTVHIKQSSLGNDYRMESVKAHDHRGWNEGLFHMQLTIPQYNYRLGHYFNKKQDLGIELNFDHTKYIIADQHVRVKGTMGNAAVDNDVMFNQANGFYYFLNNGANFFLFNLVKRWPLYARKDRKFYADFIGKAGIGPVVPHVQNSLFGQHNDPQFQFGGWNTGVETAVRATFAKYAYLEFSQKVDYARYSNLKVYEGRARQSFGCYELILSLGVIVPSTHHNPLFTAAGADKEEAK